MNSEPQEQTTVHPIRAGIVASAGKQALLDTIAAAYDDAAAREGEPIAVVYAFVNADGGGVTGYHVLGETERNSLYIARAVQMVATDAHQWLSPQYYDD